MVNSKPQCVIVCSLLNPSQDNRLVQSKPAGKGAVVRYVSLFIAVMCWVCFCVGIAGSSDQPATRPQVEPLKKQELQDVRGMRDALRAGKNENLIKQYYSTLQSMADSVHSYDVLHYQLDITFNIPDPSLSGIVVAQCKSNVPDLSSVILDLVDLTVDEVRRDGIFVDYEHTDGQIQIELGETFDIGEHFEIVVAYHGTPTAGYRNGNDIFFTSVQPSKARYWWPCYDEPWDKATADINATVPSGYIVASNGILTETIEDSVNNTVTYRWSESYPIATYLVSVAISQYVTFSDTYYPVTGGDPMDVIFYVTPSLLEDAQVDFSRTVEMIELYSTLFGEYPFVDEKYGTAVAPMNGAMEHQTCTTYSMWLIMGGHNQEWIVAHELAHQWWGDMVTLLDWRHMWLNEGFATYSEALWAEYLDGEDGLRTFVEGALQGLFKVWESMSPENRYPIFDPPPGHLFSRAEYEKGGCVLHMLRFVVGTDLFFESLRTYGQRYMYGNATTDELKEVFEEVTGQELDWFFDQWIYSPGYPEYQYMWEADSVESGLFEVTVHVNQIQTNAPIFIMPVEFTIITDEGERTDTVVVDQAYQTIQFSVDNTPNDVLLDRNGWILKNVTDITSPLVSYADHSIDDGAGNDNGVPDPGETVDLVVTLLNTGMEATGLAASISTEDPDVEIIVGSAEFGDAVYGQTVANENDPFVIRVTDEVNSHMARFVLDITGNGGYCVGDSLYIAIGPATILIVDDDRGDEYEAYYTEGLLLSYPFDLWEIETLGVPFETLSHYEAVVWFTGDDRHTTLTPEEQEALRQYLDGGGNLFISGQDIGYDLVEDGSVDDYTFFNDYLKAAYVGDVSSETTISGVSSDPISGDFQTLSLAAGGARNQNSPSIIEALPGTNTVFTYGSTGHTAGIKYSGDFKIVYFAFGYEGLGDSNGIGHARRRATVMDRIVEWFRYVPCKGDVNEDGTVNVVDVILGINIILDIIKPSPNQFWAADFTDDGNVNVLDIIRIVNEILGSPEVK